MKRIATIFALLTIFATLADAQDGIEWVSLNGPLNRRIMRVVVTDSGYIFAATAEDGIFRSKDNGVNWGSVGFGSTYTGALTLAKNGDLYAGTKYGGVFRSTNMGNSWNYLGLVNRDVKAIVLNDNSYIFAATTNDGIFRSTDNGLTWLRVSNLLWNRDMVITSRGDIFIVDGSVVRSTDNGVTWINKALPNNEGAMSIAIDSHDNVVVGTVFQGIFRSTDNGESWDHIGAPAESLGYHWWTAWEIESIVINEKGYIFAGTTEYNFPADTGGVVVTTDNGATWRLEKKGFPITSVWSLAVDRDGFVLAGATQYGVYRTAQSTTVTSVVEIPNHGIPQSYALHENFPNPFNPSTTIWFELPRRAIVTMNIYNVLGELVATPIHEEEYGAGAYSVTFDASMLPSGTYFYRMESGVFYATKKMLLVK